MTKLRVHELAKELGMENKDLMEICLLYTSPSPRDTR